VERLQAADGNEQGMTGADIAGHLEIRRMAPADLAQVDAILRESPEAAQWSLSGSFSQMPETIRVLVAEEGGEAAGVIVAGVIVVQVAGGDAEILNLAVRRDRRRRGVARALLAFVIAELRSMQAESVYLEVRESNAPARALYEAEGFANTGRRRSYYENPKEDALVLSLRLALSLALRLALG
jgi:ribosomal-protein-alanine acetyltransferase